MKAFRTCEERSVKIKISAKFFSLLGLGREASRLSLRRRAVRFLFFFLNVSKKNQKIYFEDKI